MHNIFVQHPCRDFPQNRCYESLSNTIIKIVTYFQGISYHCMTSKRYFYGLEFFLEIAMQINLLACISFYVRFISRSMAVYFINNVVQYFSFEIMSLFIEAMHNRISSIVLEIFFHLLAGFIYFPFIRLTCVNFSLLSRYSLLNTQHALCSRIQMVLWQLRCTDLISTAITLLFSILYPLSVPPKSQPYPL